MKLRQQEAVSRIFRRVSHLNPEVARGKGKTETPEALRDVKDSHEVRGQGTGRPNFTGSGTGQAGRKGEAGLPHPRAQCAGVRVPH